MIWITSDHHFNHTNIIKYANRPFDNVDEMNKSMIDKWNWVVHPDDIVLHLGDFSLQMDEKAVTDLVSKLHGNIVLIRGNHDRFGVTKYKRCGFMAVKKRLELGNFVLTHRPLPKEDLNGKVNFHGHTHSSTYDFPSTHINVGVEAHNYYPIDFITLCLFYNIKKYT